MDVIPNHHVRKERGSMKWRMHRESAARKSFTRLQYLGGTILRRDDIMIEIKNDRNDIMDICFDGSYPSIPFESSKVAEWFFE